MPRKKPEKNPEKAPESSTAEAAPAKAPSTDPGPEFPLKSITLLSTHTVDFPGKPVATSVSRMDQKNRRQYHPVLLPKINMYKVRTIEVSGEEKTIWFPREWGSCVPL